MELKEMSYKEALRLALNEEMKADEAVVVIGEDIGNYGGACGITLGLLEEFGEERVLDTPKSESAIVGCGIGAALTGLRPICEMSSTNQAAMALGEIINGAAKAHYLSGGSAQVPMVICIPVGMGKAMPQNSQSLESLFAMVPGLKVVAPSTPAQAKGLLKAAVQDDNPVVVLVSRDLMDMKGPVPVTPDYYLPLEQSYVERAGSDLTVVSWGTPLVSVIEAAEHVGNEDISVEVINPMTLHPMDLGPVYDSVKKTGRLLIVHEGSKTGGIGSEIAASVVESDCFEYLEMPIARLGGLDVPIPYNRSLESVIAPQNEDIIQSIYDLLGLN